MLPPCRAVDCTFVKAQLVRARRDVKERTPTPPLFILTGSPIEGPAPETAKRTKLATGRANALHFRRGAPRQDNEDRSPQSPILLASRFHGLAQGEAERRCSPPVVQSLHFRQGAAGARKTGREGAHSYTPPFYFDGLPH